MKHKLSVLSVILALLALVVLFTACGAKENTASEGTIKPRTITIYSITGDGTTPEAIAAVQEAMNKITRSMYNTEVILRLYPVDEYETVLKKVIQANEDGDNIVNSGTSDAVTTEAITTNEYGRPITVYPEAHENQFDIFLIPDGVDNFDFYTQEYFNYTENNEIVEMGGVALDISSQINENSASYILNQYIPANVLNFCRADSIDSSSALYGIPSNNYYGDAEYFLVNKALYAEYNYDPSTITDMYSVQSFLVDLAADCGAGKRPGTVPLYNTPGMNLVSVTGMHSVVTQCVTNTASVASGMFTPMNIFAIPNAQKAMGFVNAINIAGGIMPRVTDDVDFSASFGAAYVYGSAEVLSKYADDYYIMLTSVPKIDGDDIYKGVYAVSKYASEYADRCMQILTALTTNAEYRNLFAYGVENVNYIIDEETGLVSWASVKPENVYEMDLERTGNMFLLKQNSNMTEAELLLSDNNWAIAKQTNNDAIVSPYAKFVLSTKYAASDYSSVSYKAMSLTIPELEKLYDEIWVWIAEYPTYVNPDTGENLNTFNEYLLVLQERLNANIYVSSAASQIYSTSIRSQYANWYGVTYGGNK